ncbi:MAG: hypothetical protein H6765_04140 [Candidatus Peribacteria bacterium]|nr:MAG: hypothetical protein H6765_04140 [Candidatus Peribacteria bacterium]
MKFIYPDLYRIKVFAGGELMTKEQIEESVVQYLKEKVGVYNAALSEQLSKAPGYYALHTETYDFIEQADVAATPNRSYQLLPEDYFVEKL